MKIIATVRDYFRHQTGGILQLNIDNIHHAELAKELKEDKTYSVEIKEVKSARSLQQNKYLWALLAEIDKELNGERSNDEWSIYIQALERAGAKYEYIGALPEAEDMIKKNFRAIKFIKKIDLNGVEGNMYKCFIGSSKMDVKEMGMLIDTVLDMAMELGIETDYWKEVLK